MHYIIALVNFNMLNIELLKKYLVVVAEQATSIILYSKSALCMDNIGKDTKHTRRISRRIRLLRYIRDNNNLGLIIIIPIEIMHIYLNS